MSHQSCKNSESINSSKAYIEINCESEYPYYKNNSLPFGITVIPGSGKLSEFPVPLDNFSQEDGGSLLDYIKNTNFCPRSYPPTNICIKECNEFSAVSSVNFINGDLIIADSEKECKIDDGILQHLTITNTDTIDIFPNLLGINGSLYIVGTKYRQITGFDKLRFVTGNIVIVNNPNLISFPNFPSLLSVGGRVIPKVCNEHDQSEICCTRSAIIIANNCCLRKITGFEALRQVKDGIFIVDNPCLSHICGFIHLYRTDRIVIKGNSRLTKVVGFCYTDTINIGLFIIDNNLDGDYDFLFNAFLELETVGRIVIIGNNSLKSLKFDSLRIVKEFIVRANKQLIEIESSVQFVSNLHIEGNKDLVTIKFATLEEINQLLTINKNISLVSIDTFNDLRRVGAGIIIADNTQLTEINGFNKLKYIGAGCVNNPKQNKYCEDDEIDIDYNWLHIIHITDCNICDKFTLTAYDEIRNSYIYRLPNEFYKLVCNPKPNCCEENKCEEIPSCLSFSFIVFRNQKLKLIGGFTNLKHINSNIYIIYNATLHTINAFEHLCYALDIWIRNNYSLKHIIGLGNLISVRDLIVYESLGLINLNNIKSLEFAQKIAIEAKTEKTVKYPSVPIPSIFGYTLYYGYDIKA